MNLREMLIPLKAFIYSNYLKHQRQTIIFYPDARKRPDIGEDNDNVFYISDINEVENEWYECDICRKTFGRWEDLLDHMVDEWIGCGGNLM